ncbi:FRG domain-containing protein [Polaribacter batillariae]|uniref:FRG domain-containing protein n=1 Tax=Polaribacter batillariae TaxID=2808900 RepID=A0ABX7SW08_9FLAO|nr:FRG domain-containing protein [Polaribacter batillariae]QTD37701.1 FRG domain-containing protein [Polaribacter batillariae]
MQLEEYSEIKEKEEFFVNGGSKINHNINKIFAEIEKFKSEGTNFVFRGCSEAKYRLYNSAQRIYIQQELHKQVPSDSIAEHYRDFITELIKICRSWNNGVIERLLESTGIDPNNALAYLSYMQHFGVPTPLLDYSYNPYVALFFAIDGLVYKPSDKEIDNYFSFYYTFTNSTVFESWKYVFDENLKKVDITYEKIDENDMAILLPDEELYQIMNSVNIINQEGLFFYNNHPWYPLERTYKEYTDFLLKEWGQEKFDKLMTVRTFSGCYNIHKSLIPAIKEKLSEMGINKNHIYPDMADFRKSVTNNGILNSLTLEK